MNTWLRYWKDFAAYFEFVRSKRKGPVSREAALNQALISIIFLEEYMATLDEVLAAVVAEGIALDTLGTNVATLKTQLAQALAGGADAQAKIDQVSAAVAANATKIAGITP